MPSNRAGFYDHNGTTFNSLPILEAEKRKLPFSLFTCSFSGFPGRIRTYYMSLERYFQMEDSAVGIVGNGSVGTELFKKQV